MSRLAAQVITALAAVTFGCDLGTRSVPATREATPAPAPGQPAPPPERLASLGYAAGKAVPATAAPAGPAPPQPAGQPSAVRKLIRTGQIELEVGDVRTAAEKAAETARSQGGYVGESKVSRGEGDRLQATVTLRVPAERFESALAVLRSLGKVRSEAVAVQDVTKAYGDLETRLRVKRETEARLRDILRTRTAKLSEVLEAERELARVTEEIETMEGERRYYDQQIALSTIVVSLREPEAVVRSGALEPLRDAFRESLHLMAVSVAALVYAAAFLLPWIVVLLPVGLAVRAVQRRRRHQRS